MALPIEEEDPGEGTSRPHKPADDGEEGEPPLSDVDPPTFPADAAFQQAPNHDPTLNQL